jgi:RNA polymerase sigma-70 factor (ECF subfamily)
MSVEQLRLVPSPEPAPEVPVPTLEEAFVRFGGFVSVLGLRILGRRDELDDLRQDVFLEAHRNWRKIRKGGSVQSWLATVTVRLARRRLRARRVRYLLGLTEPHDYADVADNSAGPEDRALLARVYEALDQLPVEQRLVWCLRYVDGERLPRVAELCGCSLATVKRRIGAADTRMKWEIGDG